MPSSHFVRQSFRAIRLRNFTKLNANGISINYGASLLILVLVLVPFLRLIQGEITAFDQIDQTERAREVARMEREALGIDEEVPELFEGEVSDLGPQNILELTPRHYFEFVADSQIYHTDNLFLTDVNPEDAVVLVNTLQGSFIPKQYDVGTGKLIPRIGFRQQWYDLSTFGPSGGDGFDYDDLDFNAQTGFLDGTYRFGEGWSAEIGLDIGHVGAHGGKVGSSWELAPRWRLLKRFDITPGRQLLLGYDGVYHDANGDRIWVGSLIPGNAVPRIDYTDRIDHRLTAAASAVWRERTVVQAYYQYRLTAFQNSSRNDHLHTIGANLNYFFTDQLSMRSFLTYDHRDTQSSPVADYDRFMVGVGLNFTLPF